MGRNRIFAFALALTGFLASCGKFNDRMGGILSRAESVMDSCPDSAVRTLGEITNPRWLSRPNRALYCLLSTQAASKVGQPLPSDSLINVAVNYYSRHLKDPHAILAYYYQSKALQGVDEKARLETLLSAESLIPECRDDGVAGTIYFYLGKAYQKQYVDSVAKRYYKKALMHYKKSGQAKNEFYALHSLGWSHLYMKNFAEAEKNFQAALTIAEDLCDSLCLDAVYSSLSNMYNWLDKYDEAKECVIKCIEFNKGNAMIRHYVSLGDVYFRQGQLDSAKFFYNYYLSNRPLDTAKVASVLYSLYRLESQQYAFQEALKTFEEYYKMYLAINDRNERNSIIEIRQKYDSERLNSQRQQLIIRNRTLLIGFLVMLLIAVASVSTYKVVVAKKNKRISDDMVKLREAEIANQQKTIDNQQLEMKIDKLNLLKSSAKTLIESKLRIIQKMNDILKLWSDDRRDNRRFALAAKEFFDDYKFTQDSWKDIYEISNHIVSEDFLHRLRATELKLSEDDLKLCCMVLVEIKTNQIADILGIQPASVSKKRNRLKKKIDGNSDKTLKKLLSAWI